MKITLDVTQPLTNTERMILHILLGDITATVPPPAPEPGKTETPPEPVTDTGGDARARAEARGRQLIKDGDAATVRRGLDAAGASRVSSMTEAQAQAFLAEVGDE